MEPIVGLEDWFEGSDKNITSCRRLDDLFSEPAEEEGIPLEAAEVDDPDAPEERSAITPDELTSARDEALAAASDEEKTVWFDKWASVISESSVAALDDLQKLSDALSDAQRRAVDDAELVEGLRTTVAWQSKMTGPAPPFARPVDGSKVACLLCETEGECDGKWDERTGVHVCAKCVENAKSSSIVITAEGMQSLGLGHSGTATTVYNWSTNNVSWTHPTYTVTACNARDIIVNASWTGTVPEPEAAAPVEEKQEVVPDEVAPGTDEVVTESAPAEPEQTPPPSTPEGFRISLPEKFTAVLKEEPEDGMGYQLVNIMMASGKLYENITVLNCEEAIVPENINPEEIELIERVNADATEA